MDEKDCLILRFLVLHAQRVFIPHYNLFICVQLAFKFVPTREQFVAKLDTSEHDNLEQQVNAFVEAFGPLLREIHEFLVSP